MHMLIYRSVFHNFGKLKMCGLQTPEVVSCVLALVMTCIPGGKPAVQSIFQTMRGKKCSGGNVSPHEGEAWKVQDLHAKELNVHLPCMWHPTCVFYGKSQNICLVGNWGKQRPRHLEGRQIREGWPWAISLEYLPSCKLATRISDWKERKPILYASATGRLCPRCFIYDGILSAHANHH